MGGEACFVSSSTEGGDDGDGRALPPSPVPPEEEVEGGGRTRDRLLVQAVLLETEARGRGWGGLMVEL